MSAIMITNNNTSSDKAPLDLNKVRAMLSYHTTADAADFEAVFKVVMVETKMQDPTKEQKEQLSKQFNALVEYLKEKKAADVAEKALKAFMLRHRARDASDAVAFTLSEKEFIESTFISALGFKFSEELARLAFRNEYYRADKDVIRSKVNSENRYIMDDVSKSIETIYADLFKEVPHLLTSSKVKGAYGSFTSYLVWMCVYDRKNMPLNSIAVGIFAKHEIFGREYRPHALPHDVGVLLDAWCHHVCRIKEAYFAPCILALKDPTTTFETMYIKLKADRAHIDELRAMILAFQFVIMRVVDTSTGDAENIPLATYWDKLKEVDAVARKFKTCFFRECTSSVDFTSDGTEFEVKSLHLATVSEAGGNSYVHAFLNSLKKIRSDNDESPQKIRDGTPRKVICNHCGVTSTHRGSNCPWRGVKTLAELKKMSLAEKEKGPQ